MRSLARSKCGCATRAPSDGVLSRTAKVRIIGKEGQLRRQIRERLQSLSFCSAGTCTTVLRYRHHACTLPAPPAHSTPLCSHDEDRHFMPPMWQHEPPQQEHENGPKIADISVTVCVARA